MIRRRRYRSRIRRRITRIAIVLSALILVTVAPVVSLRWLDPMTSAFMLQDESGRDPVLHEWLAWSDMGIAPTLAVVAAEDQKFADHFGFDVQSIRDSIEDFDKGEPLRGASTITQQVAKNLFLWPGRSFLRKGLEAYITVLIELSWPKARIVEVYLNIAEFGPGIYGVSAASDYYFGKEAARISDAEAALLAAVLPNPHALQVERPSEYVRKRQRWILGQMRRLRREQWIVLLR